MKSYFFPLYHFSYISYSLLKINSISFPVITLFILILDHVQARLNKIILHCSVIKETYLFHDFCGYSAFRYIRSQPTTVFPRYYHGRQISLAACVHAAFKLSGIANAYGNSSDDLARITTDSTNRGYP